MKIKNAFVFDVTEETFQEKVLAASELQPIVVDFWADWCPPCLVLAPVLEKVVGEYGGGLLLAKVEVDDNMRLAGQNKLRGFPTVILFKQGKELGRFSGAKPVSAVREFLDEHLA